MTLMGSSALPFCPAGGGCACGPCEVYVGFGVCVTDSGQLSITPGTDSRSPADAHCALVYLPSKLDFVTHLPSCPKLTIL